MLYFNEFENLTYKFGDEVDTVIFQNLSTYVDVIDEIVKADIEFPNDKRLESIVKSIIFMIYIIILPKFKKKSILVLKLQFLYQNIILYIYINVNGL